MSKKRTVEKGPVKKGKKPQSIIIIGVYPNEKGNVGKLRYLCDGDLKYTSISYLNISCVASTLEMKLVIQWLERFHPNRTHLDNDPEYEAFLRSALFRKYPKETYPDDNFIS